MMTPRALSTIFRNQLSSVQLALPNIGTSVTDSHCGKIYVWMDAIYDFHTDLPVANYTLLDF
jgi:hypothetical protein